jgi:hypothetical protein
VVRELQIIFGLDAVAVEMGILRQLAKLLQHLRGVAAGTAIDPIGRLAATAALRAIVATAPPAIVVAVIVVATIIVQGRVFLNPASPLGTEPAG